MPSSPYGVAMPPLCHFNDHVSAFGRRLAHVLLHLPMHLPVNRPPADRMGGTSPTASEAAPCWRYLVRIRSRIHPQPPILVENLLRLPLSRTLSRQVVLQIVTRGCMSCTRNSLASPASASPFKFDGTAVTETYRGRPGITGELKVKLSTWWQGAE